MLLSLRKGSFLRPILIGVSILGGVLAVAAVVLLIYVARTWDAVYEAPLPAVRVSTDPAVIARGAYLAYGPAHCIECHATPDALDKLADGVMLPLSGGLAFGLGPLGTVYASNLTPDPETGIGRYSDAHIARMMRWAVRPDGRATIEPLMPFGNMSDDDLSAIVSFLRAQPPVRNVVPASEWRPFGKVVKSLSGTFKPRTSINPPERAPAEGATPARGEYLARFVGNCVGCHTPRDSTTFAATGPEFSGGFEMEPRPAPGADPNVWFRTPNLTPAPGGGLLKFPDRETWVARFQRGGRHEPGSVMPWEAFARMTTDDIAALYEFFKSLPPVAGPTGEAAFRVNTN
jgi:mono/diheme cytochrome c family protein